MKKYILIFALLFTFGAVGASAQSYVFSSDLSLGSSNNDVANLQAWLIGNGFDIPAISAGATNKGYFGAQTKAAVVRYQASVGLPATGFVGTLTRARLNGGRGGANTSIKVFAPNGGEVWQKGTIQNISWNAGVLPRVSGATELGDIWVKFPLPACAEPSQPIRCMIAVRAPLLIASNINLYQGSYAWTVGNTQIAIPCASGSFCDGRTEQISEGQYKIQICSSDRSACDESDNYFTIGSNVTSNQTPVINGFDAPVSLNVGQVGTWTIRATDPQNQVLSYWVTWGDELGNSMASPSASGATQFLQTTTFTHSYTMTGTFTVSVTVRNASGLTAQTSATVTVGNSSGGGGTAGPLRIVTPNGGETWQKNTVQTIRWTSPYYFRATNADLKLLRTYECYSQVCPAIAYAPYTIATNIGINQNAYNWNVGAATDYSSINQTVPDGQYRIQICEAGSTNCDTSDATFTITSPNSTSNLPDINILSPNGGETWYAGSNQTITVNISGDSSRAGNLVTTSLIDSANQETVLQTLAPVVTSGVSTGSRSYSVYVPTSMMGGNYKLFVKLYASTGTSVPQQQAYDYSDNYLTLNPVVYNYNYPKSDAICPVGYACVPTTSNLLRVCPTEQIQNNMPSIGGSNVPSTYYILNGQRREVTEFDALWVGANCRVPVQTVY